MLRKIIKIRKIIYVILMFIVTLVYVSDAIPPRRQIANPQLSMVGTRALSLGKTNPTLQGDVSASLINPASLGSLNIMPISFTQQKVLGQFDVVLAQYSQPVEIPLLWTDEKGKLPLNLGISYGSNSLSGIPNTIKESNTIRSIGVYSAGFQVLHIAGTTTTYDLFGFDQFYSGVGFKYLRQYIQKDARATTSVDFGVLGIKNSPYWVFDQVGIGISILNFIPRTLEWKDVEKGSAILPFQIFIGVRGNTLDDKLSLFLHNTSNSVALGAEYYLQEKMLLRGSSSLKDITIGTGMIFDHLAAVGKNLYSVRIDFNYSQYQKPLNSDPTYSFGLTLLGESKLDTPQILIPKDDLHTNKEMIYLKGVGPKNAMVHIYNNEKMYRSVMTDRYGFWKIDEFPLNEGENMLVAKSYSIDKGTSIDSESRLVDADTIPPELDIVIYPTQTKLVVSLSTEDELRDINAKIDGRKLNFFKIEENVWQASIKKPKKFRELAPVPKEMSTIQFSASDDVGNVSEEEEYPFFVSLEYPKNKLVHYKEVLRYIGETSDLTEAILIDGEEASIDEENNFSFVQQLIPGKNLVNLSYITLNDVEISHKMKVLYLKTFSDIKDVKERREIEFLATLGVLHGDDDKFNPEEPVTRGYLTKMMVNLSGYELPKVESDLFPDISQKDPLAPYVLAAIENGLMFANITGLYEPEQELTFDEVIFFLENSDMIEEVEPNRETDPLTLKELAQFLAFTPEYERKIERLIDWDVGYNN